MIQGSKITATAPINSRPFSPQLELETLYAFDGRGRIVSAGAPDLGTAALFSLIRSNSACAFAVHANVPDDVAKQIEALARVEPPVGDLQAAPVHAQKYLSLLCGKAGGGPAFIFPDILPHYPALTTIKDNKMLVKYLRGWEGSDIEGWSPIIAVVEDGQAVSACFTARRSSVAAEAGLNTSENWRGRGLAAQVTAAWAQAIRAEGLLPIYSTSWDNHASRAVARKLDLIEVASNWNIGL